MGDADVFLAGGVVGGAFVGSLAYKAGYEKREQELGPYITGLEQQNRVKDALLTQKDEKIAELQAKLESRKIPLLSKAVRAVKARLRGRA